MTTRTATRAAALTALAEHARGKLSDDEYHSDPRVVAFRELRGASRIKRVLWGPSGFNVPGVDAYGLGADDGADHG